MQRPPGGGAALVALFTVASLAEGALWGQLNAFVPLYLPELGVGPADVAQWTGAATMVSSAVGLLALPLWGALADRYARKPVIVRSFVVYVLGCTVAALAGGAPLLVLGRTLMGLSMGNSGLMMATLNERVTPARRGLAFAIFNGASPLGAFLGPIAGGPVVDAHGVRALLGLDTAIMLAFTAALAFGYRDRYVAPEQRPVATLARESLGLLVGSPRLRRLFPSLFFLFGGWMLANLYLTLVVAARFPTPALATRVGWVLAAGGAGTAVLAPALGALGDRYGTWRVLMAAAIVQAACWPLPALVPDFLGFTAAWALVNGLASGVFALGFVVLADAVPAGARGRVMSFAYLPSTGGYGIAAAVGWLAPGHVVALVFPLATALTAVGVAGLAWSRRAS